MFCSTIIPTVGRATLNKAVCSALDQKFPTDEYEIIVVNDSGKPLSPAKWQDSKQVQILNTNRRERSTARNTGAAIARGKYLHFLDDDDWLLPDALQHIRPLTRDQEAGWLYGGARLLDVNKVEDSVSINLSIAGNCFLQTMTGEWIPLQASLIRSDVFFAAGGFNPHMPSAEDKDLSQRIAFRADMAFTPATVVVISRGGESTTNYELGLRLSSREREKYLKEKGAFSRMLSSANSDYWKGRLVRTYIASLIWNLKHKKIGASFRQLFFCCIAVLSSFRCLLSSNFWRALTNKHMSRIVEES